MWPGLFKSHPQYGRRQVSPKPSNLTPDRGHGRETAKEDTSVEGDTGIEGDTGTELMNIHQHALFYNFSLPLCPHAFNGSPPCPPLSQVG